MLNGGYYIYFVTVSIQHRLNEAESQNQTFNASDNYTKSWLYSIEFREK